MTYIDIANNMAMALAIAGKRIKSDFEMAKESGIISTFHKESKRNLPDFVTNTDKESERIIRETLNEIYPNIPFVGEECGGNFNQKDFFLVDPLDGTSNFVALRDYFSICAAYIKDNEVVAAVITDPLRDITVTAAKGYGAFINNKKIDLSSGDSSDLSQTQLECELSFTSIESYRLIENVMPKVSGMRKSGSTALDILNMVAGRNIVCIASGLEPHDIAAALLIVSEAGGTITDFSGIRANIFTKDIVAAPSLKQNMVLNLLSI